MFWQRPKRTLFLWHTLPAAHWQRQEQERRNYCYFKIEMYLHDKSLLPQPSSKDIFLFLPANAVTCKRSAWAFNYQAWKCKQDICEIKNRLGVAGAVLITPDWQIDYSDCLWKYFQKTVSPKSLELENSNVETMFTNPCVSYVMYLVSYVLCHVSFVKIFSRHCISQNIKAMDLKFRDNVMCHLSRVMCQVSGVRCQVSHVTWHTSCVKKDKFL